MKLLFYGESPLNPTGFGQVNKHLLRACSRVCDVTVVATTHYYKEYDRKQYPYEIIPCDPTIPPDATGQRNLENINKYLDARDWDVFFIQGDMGASVDLQKKAALIQQENPDKKATIFYMPIDGDVSTGYAFEPLTWASAPVVYTNHAKSVIEKYAPNTAERTSVIWLGCETDVFYPLSPEEKRDARRQFFGEAYLDRFLVINVNRNQVRKDLARCMWAFHEFHQKYPDTTLYMHSVQVDAGGCLPVQAMLGGVDLQKFPAEVAFSSLDLNNAWPRSELNRMYNACDLLVSTSYGEGWGLTTTEAMCAGIPVMVPANTANLDILGERKHKGPLNTRVFTDFGEGTESATFWTGEEFERGWGIKTGGDLDHTSFIYNNGGAPVPHIWQDSFVDTLEYIYHHREEAHLKAVKALEWCKENTWEHREKDWENLLWLIKSSLG